MLVLFSASSLILKLTHECLAVPDQQERLVGNPEYDWFFQTKPQEFAAGAPRPWPRVKVLGGRSAVSHFVRPYFFHSSDTSNNFDEPGME